MAEENGRWKSMTLLGWLINGLRMGSIYALIALGYNMVYGIVRLINFAHGDIIMVGAYTIWVVIVMLGAPVWLSVLLAVLICALFGMAIERLAYKPLRNAPRISLLITALAVSIFLQNLFMRIFKPDPKPLSIKLTGPEIHLGDLKIDFSIIATVAISVLVMVLLWLLVQRSKMGKAMRAVSEDGDAARLMGINVNTTISFAFGMGSGLAGLGAFFYALAIPQISFSMGAMPGLKAFVAAVLGGIGSIPGAVVGGYLLGLAESIVRGVSSQWADAVVFLILIVVLLVKPAGLLGQNVKEKV